MRDLLVVQKTSLTEIVSTAVLLAVVVVVVVDLSRVFHAVDSAALQLAHRCTPAPDGTLAVPAALPTVSVPARRWQHRHFEERVGGSNGLQLWRSLQQKRSSERLVPSKAEGVSSHPPRLRPCDVVGTQAWHHAPVRRLVVLPLHGAGWTPHFSPF